MSEDCEWGVGEAVGRRGERHGRTSHKGRRRRYLRKFRRPASKRPGAAQNTEGLCEQFCLHARAAGGDTGPRRSCAVVGVGGRFRPKFNNQTAPGREATHPQPKLLDKKNVGLVLTSHSGTAEPSRPAHESGGQVRGFAEMIFALSSHVSSGSGAGRRELRSFQTRRRAGKLRFRSGNGGRGRC